MLPLNPARIPAEFRRAMALRSAGRVEEAAEILRSIIAASPGLAEPHYHLGRIALADGDGAAALEHLEVARKLKPHEPEIAGARAEAFELLGRADEALAVHGELCRRYPRAVRPRADRALLLQRLGDFDAADREFRKALKISPKEGQIYRMMLATRKLRKGDPLIAAMRKLHSDPSIKGESRIQLGFALAKAMEDSGQHDQVFRYLDPANAAMKAAAKYDPAERSAEVDGLIAAFRGFDFSAPPVGADDFAPIFVTGLPRSGTTLVEQILASHSDVTGGGEMPFALRQAYQVIGTPGSGFRPMGDVRADELAAFASAYETAVRKAQAFDRVITDKTIQSHLIIGFLKQAIPSARIILVRRDPRDLLYSIYKNLFAPGTHRYAYDLADLATYYASFVRITDFWREAMPDGFHEIHYEDLVADPEPQTRALVAAAGLDWQEACLSFHEGKREVKTLSIQQVRQPIYRSSAAAWRKYEKDLAPLTEALEREGVL